MDLNTLNVRLTAIDTDLRAVESLPYFALKANSIYGEPIILTPEHKVRIERKLPDRVRVIIDPPNPLQDPSDRRAALERYILLFDLWPNQMDDRIYYTLWATDMAHTTPARKADEIVNRIKRARERSKREFHDLVEVGAREMFRYANRVRTLPEGYHPKPGEACFGGMSICD